MGKESVGMGHQFSEDRTVSDEAKGKGWRYQPVTIEDGYVLLCEVYFDAAGKLEKWTAEPGMLPQAAMMYTNYHATYARC